MLKDIVVAKALDDYRLHLQFDDGIEGVVKRVLVSPADGWDGWVMRLFDVDPGGHTPRHAHDWPHINFVASGRGPAFGANEAIRLRPARLAE